MAKLLSSSSSMAAGVAACIILILYSSSAIMVPCLADSGSATYYTVYVPSACYGYDTGPFLPGNFIAAANSGLYNGGAACGRICTVSCTGAGCNGGGPIQVKIVDLCPGCGAGQLDLSQEAFSSIANLDQGRISIDYSC